MPARIVALAAFAACLFCISAQAQDAKLAATIMEQIEKRIVGSHAEAAVAFRMLDGSKEYFLNPDESFHAASTMKIPVMIELFHQVREGKLHFGDPLIIRNEFHSIVDGSVYRLDPADDSETDLYKAEGQTRTLRQLCDLMITVSSNLATNLMIEKLGVGSIGTTVHALGADGMNVLRGVEDQKAFDKGLNNTTTARALLQLLTAMAEGNAVDPDSSRQMVAILEQQKFNEGIPSGLPAATRVAHKTGDITKIHHDAAIVYATKPFVLVILVRGLENEKRNYTLMGDIARILYQAVE